jgi:hypothetical protein
VPDFKLTNWLVIEYLLGEISLKWILDKSFVNVLVRNKQLIIEKFFMK